MNSAQKNKLRLVLHYVLDAELEDFEEQAADHDLTIEQALAKKSALSLHVYYLAWHGLDDLDDK